MTKIVLVNGERKGGHLVQMARSRLKTFQQVTQKYIETIKPTYEMLVDELLKEHDLVFNKKKEKKGVS